LKITITGTGNVSLVTGACISEVGHQITCFYIDEDKISLLIKGISPIYGQGLDELIQCNIANGRLTFSSSPEEAYSGAVYQQELLPYY